jgi:ABC-2 type transport system permease protein
MFVGLGATMDDMQSAGNSQGLVIMLPAMSFLFIAPVVQNPNGVVSRFASLFPFTSWVILTIRDALSPVPFGEIALSAAILIATTAVMIKVAAKIFRIGMLMYGKNATPREIWKWLRYKDLS